MRILLFAHLKTAAGRAEFDLPGGSVDADGLWQKLIELHPGLERYRASSRLARNWEYAGPGVRFEPGDEVAVIPPVSGG